MTAFSLPAYASDIQIGAVGDVSISQRLIETRSIDLEKIKLYGGIIFANFEGVLSEGHTNSRHPLGMKLTMPPRAVGILRKIGVNTLSLANNHTLDIGSQAYSQTLVDLRGNKFIVAGLN